MNSIRIVIVDDHVILRDGLASIFRAESGFQVVGEAGSVAAAIEVAHAARPDLILMDYTLPDGTGLDATQKILSLYPEIQVVLLTVHEEDDLLFAAVRAGAKGYLLKNISTGQLVAKLRSLLVDGDAALSAEQTQRILSEFARTAPSRPESNEPGSILTDRELEVLQLLVAEATNREIASSLHISLHTVKNHVHNILEKLGVSNRREAAEAAVKRRLLSDPRR